MKKLPPKEELEAALAQGTTQSELARAYGVSRQSVFTALHYVPSPREQRNQERRKRIAKLRAQGLTWVVIAAAVGVSYETIMRDARKLREEATSE